MIIDLHNHTYHSYDGSESPCAIADNAISCGIGILGFCDHQFTDGFNLDRYISELRGVKEQYRRDCDIKIGLEVGTRPKPDNLLAKSASKQLDYCLFECLDSEAGMDLYEFLDWRRLFSCPVGLAHTDIFALGERYGVDIPALLKKEEIFWEINTSGNYAYYYDFITNAKKRRIVRDSRITLSVGSDTHRLYDFCAAKVLSANALVQELGNPVLFCERRR